MTLNRLEWAIDGGRKYNSISRVRRGLIPLGSSVIVSCNYIITCIAHNIGYDMDPCVYCLVLSQELLTFDKLHACELRKEGNNQVCNFLKAECNEIQEISKDVILYKIRFQFLLEIS